MSILSTISRGKRPRHIFALIYGTDGVGKSTLCSHAPNPIFIGAEKGTEQLDVARFPQTESISELLAQIRALQSEKREFDSVVLDSLDWVEPLIWKAVCDEGKVETIEQYAGGYGKGYVRALDLWRTLLRELSVLNEEMHVLLIGHAQIKSFQDPELPTAYDRCAPGLSTGTGSIGLMTAAGFLSGTGGIGGRTVDRFGMASYDARSERGAEALQTVLAVERPSRY
jgi:hypothetical protein